eukprot:EG_transcript_6927
MGSPEPSDKVQQILLILPHVAPRQAAAALERHHGDVRAALDALMASPAAAQDSQFPSLLQQKLKPVKLVYEAELDKLTALPSRTIRQFTALFRLLRDELRAFWVSAACLDFKARLEEVLASVTADSKLLQVAQPLMASASDALAHPAALDMATLVADAEYAKASLPQAMEAGRRHVDQLRGLASCAHQTVRQFRETPQYGTLRAFFDSMMEDLSEQEPTIRQWLALVQQAWPQLRTQTGWKAWLQHVKEFWDEALTTGVAERQSVSRLLSRAFQLLQELKDFLGALSGALQLPQLAQCTRHIAEWMRTHPDLSHVRESCKAVLKCAWAEVQPLWSRVPKHAMELGQKQLKNIPLKPVKAKNFELWDLVLREVTVQQENVHFLAMDDAVILIVDAFVAHINRFQWRASFQSVEADSGTGEVQPVRGTFRVAIPVTSSGRAPAFVELQPVHVSVQKPSGSWLPSWVYNSAMPMFAEHIGKILQESLSELLTKKATELSQQVAPQLQPIYPLVVRLFEFYQDPRKHAMDLLEELTRPTPAGASAPSSSGGHPAPALAPPAPPAAQPLGAAAAPDNRRPALQAMGFPEDLITAALQRHPTTPVRDLME